MKYQVIERIATILKAYHTCDELKAKEWKNNHRDTLEDIAKNYLPSGSGFDSGSHIDIDDSNGIDCIILETSYHHMSEYGFYCGWSEHRITIRPTFNGPDWEIESDYSGVDDEDFYQDGFEEYLDDTLYHYLTQEIDV